jgi:hypothetical protein
MSFFASVRSVLGWSNRQNLRRSLRPLILRAEELEPRELPSVSLNLEFGTPTSPVAPGYVGFSTNAYNPATGYGWQNPSAVTGVERNTGGFPTHSFAMGRFDSFLVDLPNGTYDVTATFGDALLYRSSVYLTAQGISLPRTAPTAPGQFTQSHFSVSVTSGQLNFSMLCSNWFALDALHIADKAPRATLSNNGPGNEGSAVTATFSNPNSSLLHYSFALTTSGLATTYAAAGTSTSAPFTFTESGIYAIYGRVLDSNNTYTTYKTQVTVNDVAPTATVTNNGPVNAGSPVTVSFSNPTSPSQLDTNAGFHYSFATSTSALATTYAAAEFGDLHRGRLGQPDTDGAVGGEQRWRSYLQQHQRCYLDLPCRDLDGGDERQRVRGRLHQQRWQRHDQRRYSHRRLRADHHDAAQQPDGQCRYFGDLHRGRVW